MFDVLFRVKWKMKCLAAHLFLPALISIDLELQTQLRRSAADNPVTSPFIFPCTLKLLIVRWFLHSDVWNMSDMMTGLSLASSALNKGRSANIDPIASIQFSLCTLWFQLVVSQRVHATILYLRKWKTSKMFLFEW